MPTGKVKFFDAERGFGFIDSEDGSRVFLHANNLPTGVTTVKKGARVEFSVADGRKGPQALTVTLLDPPPALSKTARKSPDDMAVIVEDLIKVLDEVGGRLRRGRYPEGPAGEKIAAMLRRVADELEA
ncbi:cold shock protein (beta-ribbon, CspA family) [Micrococcales bacterium KH10]|nr:cold shock protein (beta-ribbon, CspA family) [Micrococcales bacterium KH10]